MSRERGADWIEVPLRAVIRTLEAGVSVNSEGRKIQEGERGVLKTSAVGGAFFDPSEHKAILPSEVARARVSPNADHIIFSRMNTPALVGASAYVGQDFPNLFLPDRLWQIDVRSREEVDVRWLAYIFASPDFRSKLSSIATGTSGSMKNIAKDRLLDLTLNLPPLAEQRRIAEILSNVDEAIQTTQDVIEQHRRVSKLVSQRLIEVGTSRHELMATDAGEVPVHWHEKRLEEIAHVERGRFSVRPRNDPRYYGGSVPFVQTGDVVASDGLLEHHTQTLNDAGLAVSKLFPPGTILITIAANIGETAVTSYPVCCPDSVVGVKPLDGIDPDWLRAFLAAQQPSLDKQATQSAQKNINLQHLRPMLVPVPPPGDQIEIGTIVRGFREALRLLGRELDVLRCLKSSLMSDLLTGRKRVTADFPLAAE